MSRWSREHVRTTRYIRDVREASENGMEDWDQFPDCPVDQRVQKKSNSGRFCAEETREAQQLREQRALESAANVNYKDKKERPVRTDLVSCAQQRKLNKVKFKLHNLALNLLTATSSGVLNTTHTMHQ